MSKQYDNILLERSPDEAPPLRGVNRRDFLRIAGFTFGGTLIAARMLLGTVFTQTSASAQTSNNRVVPKVGDLAPDFSLQDFKGNKFTLSKLTKTKSVLLWFTNLCEGCQLKIPEVLELKSLYEKKGIDVLAISVLGKDRKTVEEVIRKNNVTVRFLYDPKGEATERYSGRYVEDTCPLKNIFIIKKGGKIVYASHLSGASLNELTTQLNKITKGIQQ